MLIIVVAALVSFATGSQLDMVHRICAARVINRISWFELGGDHLLKSRDPVTWNGTIEPMLTLLGHIVDGWDVAETRLFVKTIGMESFLVKNRDFVLKGLAHRWSTNDHEKSLPVVPVANRVREGLRRAPLRNLNFIAPELMKFVLVKRVVYYEKSVWELVWHNRVMPQLLGDVHSLPQIESRSFARLKLPKDYTVSAWTNRFLRAVVMRNKVFETVLPDHGKLRMSEHIDPSEKSLTYEVGRVLGLMVVRGVTLVDVRFESKFYEYIVNVRAKSCPTFRCEADISLQGGFWDVVPLKGKLTALDLEAILTEKKKSKINAQTLENHCEYVGTTSEWKRYTWFWEIAGEDDFPIDRLSEMWAGPKLERLKLGLLSRTKHSVDQTGIVLLPATHTLLLPRYSSKAKLRQALMALMN